MSDKPEIHRYNEAGRRVLAALISCNLRLKGVDYTLKTMPEVVDKFWAEEAEKLIKVLISSMPAPWDLAGENPTSSTQ